MYERQILEPETINWQQETFSLLLTGHPEIQAVTDYDGDRGDARCADLQAVAREAMQRDEFAFDVVGCVYAAMGRSESPRSYIYDFGQRVRERVQTKELTPSLGKVIMGVVGENVQHQKLCITRVEGRYAIPSGYYNNRRVFPFIKFESFSNWLRGYVADKPEGVPGGDIVEAYRDYSNRGNDYTKSVWRWAVQKKLTAATQHSIVGYYGDNIFTEGPEDESQKARRRAKVERQLKQL